jgi:membrane protein YdbS with pleckstrin-like domain
MPAIPAAAQVAVWLTCVAILAFLSVQWPRWEYRRKSYRVDHVGIEIRQGVLWRTITSVPRSRVQHTDVSQGPLQRRFGLATLTIHTAGTRDASVELSGLARADALRIRDYLIEGRSVDPPPTAEGDSANDGSREPADAQ